MSTLTIEIEKGFFARLCLVKAVTTDLERFRRALRFHKEWTDEHGDVYPLFSHPDVEVDEAEYLSTRNEIHTLLSMWDESHDKPWHFYGWMPADKGEKTDNLPKEG